MKNMKAYVLSAVLSFFIFIFPFVLEGETAVIPGDIDHVCAYTNFFYNFPAEDFFYYLNERCLFTEKPDGKLLGSGMRSKLLRIIRWHNVIKKSLRRYKLDKNKIVAINVAEPRGYKQAAVILNMLGLNLGKTPEGKYSVTRTPGSGFSDYFRFTLLKIKTIENQMNRAGYFYFKLQESNLPVPWDFGFLREVTGLKIDSANFFETLLKDEQFSLFLGVLYRLSDKEIDYIGGLVPGPTAQSLEAWKQVYRDKKFLMGMFILSDALRVESDGVDGKGQWALPGGNDAAAFWNALAETETRTSPFEFLRSLALKDDGKLNYFYLFSYFLPPETQTALFTGPDAQKTRELYQRISLSDKEKLKDNEFPRLRDTGIYTFLYALQLKDHRFHLPHGVDRWLKAMNMEVESEGNVSRDEAPEKKERTIEILTKEYADLAPTAMQKKAAMGSKRIGVYLRLGGGLEFLDSGDFDTMMETNERVYANLENPSPTKASSNFRFMGGELGYNFGKFSLGLEIGNIQKKFNVDVPLNYLGMEQSVGFDNHRFSAFSVLVNLHYRLLDTARVNMYIAGGGGLYKGTYKRHGEYEASTIHYEENYAYTDSIGEVLKETGKQTAFGFHLGASMEFFILKKMALWVDGRYRFVDFNNMKGDGYLLHRSFFNFIGNYYKREYSGDFNFDPEIGTGLQGRSEFFVGDRRYPDGEEGLRKALLSMKGFALSLGLKWYF